MIRFEPVHEDAIIAEDDGQYCRFADHIRALSAAMSEAREVALAEAAAMVRAYPMYLIPNGQELLAARIEAKAGGAT